MAKDGQQLSPEAALLHQEALRRYRTRCFWSSSPPKTREGLQAVCSQLQTCGDLGAWRLAATIRKSLQNAD